MRQGEARRTDVHRKGNRVHMSPTEVQTSSSGDPQASSLNIQAMPDTEAARAARQFAADGFVILRQLFDDRAVAALHRWLAAAQAEPAARTSKHLGDMIPFNASDDPLQILVRTPGALSRLNGAMAASDPKWISGYAIVKPPGTPALWWHQDWWCWDHPLSQAPAAPQVAVLCYLQSTRRWNGALRVIPGSHRRRHRLHDIAVEAHSAAADAVGWDHPVLEEQGDEVVVEVDAGDVVVVDYRTLHGTLPNSSEEPRACVHFSFTPAWSALPHELRSHLIQHPCLAGAPEGGLLGSLVPQFNGCRTTLRLSRMPTRAVLGP